eukprot:TRINITY_DN5985_c0_g1_i1.p1 TRINITY_DN5985_c0_g1~~TRINITY_DN5985_c0_g1_i1.p1  ORF type:complete len:588 (+),score=120.09 TRINITY_DN5985_c0_g1_i1:253-2016(+)
MTDTEPVPAKTEVKEEEEEISRFSTPINDVHIDEKDFDVVVDGSGLIESILAGSLARSGMRVLHIDENEYYGGEYATLTWSQYNQFLKSEPANSKLFTEVPSQRGWNIDLSPKGLLSGGDYVETLINSSVGKYLEFKFIDRSLTYRSNTSSFVDLPSGKSAIFTSKDLAPMEKRRLMQLFQLIESGAPDEFKAKPIGEYLTEQLKMNKKVSDLVKYSILRLQSSDDLMTTEQAVALLKKIAESVGRYGPTDMIYSSHGLSELPQAMSRVCAIYKGISCILRRYVSEVNVSDGRVSGVTCCAGQSFSCKHFVTSTSAKINGASESTIPESRCILMAADSMFERPPAKKDDDDEEGSAEDKIYPHTITAVIAPGSISEEKCLPSKAITIFELSCETSSCPKGVTTIHLSSQISQEELTAIVLNNFIDDEAGKLRTASNAELFHRAFFSLPSVHQPDIKAASPAANIWRCPAIRTSDVDAAIIEGENMFRKIMAVEVELRGEVSETPKEGEPAEEEWVVDFEPTKFLDKLPDPEEKQPLANDPEAVLLGISTFTEPKPLEGEDDLAEEATSDSPKEENEDPDKAKETNDE